MATWCSGCWDRRRFLATGIGGLACAATPGLLHFVSGCAAAQEATAAADQIRAVVRPPTLFAGIRAPIAKREELVPRIAELEAACGDRIAGPLTHLYRFDTPVEGFDSEIGFPVSAPVDSGRVATHTLRGMHFYSRLHDGPVETAKDSIGALYEHMNVTGLSPELELVEVFHDRAESPPFGTSIELMASFLAWPEVYRSQLERVLGAATAAVVWQGGEQLTPHTPVDPRCAWVAASLERLKKHSDLDQQFDILSRVALVRPLEEILPLKAVYKRAGDLTAVFRAQEEKLKTTRTGGFVDPPRFDGKVLHVSKVPYNRAAYDAATNQRERRKAYCFCNLIREAEDPKVDPIFCYRAAGWSRQLWETVLDRPFTRCTITHSILKGDPFCAWDYHLEPDSPDAPATTT